uniref:Methyltransferase domain-containing protein n=1 Tax=Ditylum brightwellii TaxID=49249 RepID=A0A7S1YSU2_9STRA
MLRRQLYTNPKEFDAYRRGTIVPGCKICVTGVASISRNPGEALVVVQSIEVVGVPRNPQHLRGLLQCVDVERFRNGGDDDIDDDIDDDKEEEEEKVGIFVDEVAQAMSMDTPQLCNLLSAQLDDDDDDNDKNDSMNSQTTISYKQTNSSSKKRNKGIDYGKLAKTLLETTIPKDINYPPYYQLGSTGKDTALPPLTKELVSPPAWVQEQLLLEKDMDTTTTAATTASTTPLSIQKVINEYSSSGKDDPSESTSTEQQQQKVVVAGWVQNRRRFRENVAVLEIVDDFNAVSSLQDDDDEMKDIEKRSLNLRIDWTKRLKCILHPRCFTNTTITTTATDNTSSLEVYRNVFSPGSRVLLEGYITSNNDNNNDDQKATGTTNLWVTNAKLLRATWRPSIIKYILDLLSQSKFDMEEAAEAFELQNGYQQVQDELITQLKTSAERQWKAVELTRTLQNANSRVGKVTKEMEETLDCFGMWRDLYPMELVLPNENGKRSDDDDDAENDRSSPSRWQRAKKPQLEWMIQQISTVVKSHPDYGKRTIQILDVGGGKGHLANVIAESLGDSVSVHVVDISSRTIKNGMMRSKRKSLNNVQYSVNDASIVDFTTTTTTTTSGSTEGDGNGIMDVSDDAVVKGIDVVVALHACGTLSDVALGHAVMNDAAFVICPCCFRSNTHLRVMIPNNGEESVVVDVDEKEQEEGMNEKDENAINSSGGADHLTKNDNKHGNLRHHLKFATVAEWLNMEEVQLDCLRLLAEIQGDFEMAGKAMHTLCALRAGAVARHHGKSQEMLSRKSDDRGDESIDLDISIKTFPIGFSTRNLCIIGRLKTTTNMEVD